MGIYIYITCSTRLVRTWCCADRGSRARHEQHEQHPTTKDLVLCRTIHFRRIKKISLSRSPMTLYKIVGAQKSTCRHRKTRQGLGSAPTHPTNSQTFFVFVRSAADALESGSRYLSGLDEFGTDTTFCELRARRNCLDGAKCHTSPHSSWNSRKGKALSRTPVNSRTNFNGKSENYRAWAARLSLKIRGNASRFPNEGQRFCTLSPCSERAL